MENKDNKTEIVPVRMTTELKEKLQKLADKDSRKLSDYIRVQLEKLTTKK
jgi:predicted DNA-binding protein